MTTNVNINLTGGDLVGIAGAGLITEDEARQLMGLPAKPAVTEVTVDVKAE